MGPGALVEDSEELSMASQDGCHWMGLQLSGKRYLRDTVGAELAALSGWRESQDRRTAMASSWCVQGRGHET
eukprot:1831782-Rhodomonas_salina.2